MARSEGTTRRIRRTAPLLSALLWAALPLACSPTPDPSAGLPCTDCSVILISVDTLRRDRLGVYGHGGETSGRIDAHFERASIFENATSPAPCTHPAVLQFLTGRVPFEEERPRLAERLRGGGYETAAFVSQSLFYGEEGAPLPVYARGFDRFEPDLRPESPPDARALSDRVLAWLAGAETRLPLFLWLHYFDPHDPYDPPESYGLFDAEGFPELADHRQVLKNALTEQPRPRVRRWFEAGHALRPEQAEVLVARYEAEIRFVDEQIGRVLDRLRDLGVLERSIVIFTADHGERLGDNGLWDHCQRLDGAEINVPLLISRPGEGRTGRRVRAPTSTLDIVPTVLALLGMESDPQLDGQNLLGDLSGREIVTIYRSHGAVVGESWKLTLAQGRPVALHRTERDPLERVDRIRYEPEIRERLREVFESYEAASRVEELTEATREELRAVGYLE